MLTERTTSGARMRDMKTDAQRGELGVWLRRERRDRGWTVPRALTELRKRGYALSETSYRMYEGGSRRPGEEALQSLEVLYGKAPQPVEPSGAILEAVNALVLEARKEREAAEQIAAQLVRLEEIVAIAGGLEAVPLGGDDVGPLDMRPRWRRPA